MWFPSCTSSIRDEAGLWVIRQVTLSSSAALSSEVKMVVRCISLSTSSYVVILAVDVSILIG